jgi:hypothetical protein
MIFTTGLTVRKNPTRASFRRPDKFYGRGMNLYAGSDEAGAGHESTEPVTHAMRKHVRKLKAVASRCNEVHPLENPS